MLSPTFFFKRRNFQTTEVSQVQSTSEADVEPFSLGCVPRVSRTFDRIDAITLTTVVPEIQTLRKLQQRKQDQNNKGAYLK